MATIPLRSLARITSTPYFAIPGQTKTVSTKKAFPNIKAKSKPIIVTVGIDAGFKAYFVAILNSLNENNMTEIKTDFEIRQAEEEEVQETLPGGEEEACRASGLGRCWRGTGNEEGATYEEGAEGRRGPGLLLLFEALREVLQGSAGERLPGQAGPSVSCVRRTTCRSSTP